MTDSIYSSIKIKNYKLKKLTYSKKAQRLYTWTDRRLTRVKMEYRLCTWMFQSRFKDHDIRAVMGEWWRHHGLKPNWTGLDATIVKTYIFTLPFVQANRHKEYLARKEKKRLLKEADRQRTAQPQNDDEVIT